MKIQDLLDKLKFDNKKIILLISVYSIIVYIDFAFFIKLQLHGIKNKGLKITQLKKDMDNFTKDLLTMQQTQREEKSVSKPLKIISEEEMPLLLQNISDIANKYNIKIMQIKPSRDTKEKEEIIQGKRLSPITINLDLFCGYHSLGSFINDLENTDLFINVHGIKISRSTADYLYQNVNLLLITYVKSEVR